MKLLFPNGEHAQVQLAFGRTTLGSAADAKVVLLSPGIAPRHAEIEVSAMATKISSMHPNNDLTVNAKPVGTTPMELKPGDLVTFAQVRARVVAVEKAAAPTTPKAKEADVADDGRTKVRAALPKFVLRGVSGVTFGKVFPVMPSTVIGRQHDCEVPIASEEVSRRHAELKVTPDGVMVEDLGSSNGTFVNDRRITRQLMKPGDELRLDTIRFLLLAPGQDIAPSSPRAEATPAAPKRRAADREKDRSRSNVLMWSIVVVAVLTLGAVAAKVMGWY